jgi:hypothetical protein
MMEVVVRVMLDIAGPSLAVGKEPLRTPPTGANCTLDQLEGALGSPIDRCASN